MSPVAFQKNPLLLRPQESVKKVKMVICRCGRETMKVTSWTDRNPCKQFWSCSRFGSRCGFLVWVDPPIYRRA